jgi:hypothetical protein
VIEASADGCCQQAGAAQQLDVSRRVSPVIVRRREVLSLSRPADGERRLKHEWEGDAEIGGLAERSRCERAAGVTRPVRRIDRRVVRQVGRDTEERASPGDLLP